MRDTSRVAFVTGAGGAIGRAISRALLHEGHKVVMLDNDRATVEAAAAGLEGDAWPLTCDVSDARAVAVVCETVRERWGPVDVLVNNAGLLSNNKIVETTPDEWRRIHAVNLDGPYLLCRACVPAMR